MILFIILLIVTAGYLYADKDTSDRYGSARFLRNSKTLSRKHKGLSLDGTLSGRISRKASYTHSIGIAPTGSGKSQLLIMPSVAMLAGKQSIILLDVKGELESLFAPSLISQGVAVQTLSLGNHEGGLIYNPLKRAKTDSQIKELARSILSISMPTPKDPFWTESASNVLAILIELLHCIPGEYVNMANLLFLVKELSIIKNGACSVDEIVKAHAQDRPHLIHSYAALRNGNERTLSGVMTTVSTALSLFEGEKISRLTSVMGSDDNIDFTSLRKTPTVLFVSVPLSRMESSKGLVSLFFADFFSQLQDNPPADDDLDLFFLLDEIGSFNRIGNLASFISTARSNRISITLILQSLSQLTQTYGSNDSSTITSNVGHWIIFPGITCLPTLEKFKKVFLGDYTHSSYNRKTDKTEYTKKALMTVDELRRLKENQIIVATKNMLPIRRRSVPFFRNSKLLKKMKIFSKANKLRSLYKIKYKRTPQGVYRYAISKKSGEKIVDQNYSPPSSSEVKYINIKPYRRAMMERMKARKRK